MASSGTSPIFTNRTLSFALSATTMRSNGRIIVRPTPIAGPFTAATIGFVDRTSSTQSRVPSGRGADGVALELGVEHRRRCRRRRRSRDPRRSPRPRRRTASASAASIASASSRAHPRRPRVELLGTVQREQHDVVALLLEDLLVVHGA